MKKIIKRILKKLLDKQLEKKSDALSQKAAAMLPAAAEPIRAKVEPAVEKAAAARVKVKKAQKVVRRGKQTVGTVKKIVGKSSEKSYGKSVTRFDAAATPIVRVGLMADGTNTMVWSAPIVLDAVPRPQIGASSATTDGDRLSVTGSVVSAGTSTGFELKLVHSYVEDFSTAYTNSVPNATGAGPFSASVEVEPATNGWWKLVATTSDGGYDATLPAPFETKGGSVLAKAATVSAIKHHTATVTANLEILGAGTTTATLWIGDSPSNLVEVAGNVVELAKTGSFQISGPAPGPMPAHFYGKVKAVNVTGSGDSSWTSETGVFEFDTLDQGVYTWKASVEDGIWNDSGNWTVSGVPEDDCIGYPASPTAEARFLAGTRAT
ncbi:MAG: hypothetical protein II804_02110, partial [Clostridia bacterium]|nr:hypothetical protein [Clostridia bacterium]